MHSLQIICQQKYYSNYHQISIITSFLGDSAGYIDEENVMDSWRKRSDPKGRIEYRVEIYFLNPIELPDSASIQAPYSGVSAANVMVFRPIISTARCSSWTRLLSRIQSSPSGPLIALNVLN